MVLATSQLVDSLLELARIYDFIFVTLEYWEMTINYRDTNLAFRIGLNFHNIHQTLKKGRMFIFVRFVFVAVLFVITGCASMKANYFDKSLLTHIKNEKNVQRVIIRTDLTKSGGYGDKSPSIIFILL